MSRDGSTQMLDVCQLAMDLKFQLSKSTKEICIKYTLVPKKVCIIKYFKIMVLDYS